MADTKPIPEDRPYVVPHLAVKGAARAIAFYEEAFGAVEKLRMEAPDGRILHAEIDIGGYLVFLADDFPEMNEGKESSPEGLGGTTVTMHRYVPDGVWYSGSMEPAGRSSVTSQRNPSLAHAAAV